ncbi:MAG: TIGR02710 family CRISPR-associated CARF protein [Anaerolineales bacterium]
MQTLLAVTVGGSCAPVVTAIRDHDPAFVIFIVSIGQRGSRLMVDGKDKPCQADDKTPLPNILEQTGLAPEKYAFIELADPDTLHVCYQKIRQGLQQYTLERADWRKLADYTGGTKTMTAALIIVALELGWELSVVRGNRTDLLKVRDGTEMASLVNTWEVRARQQMEQAELLFNQYAYVSAGQLVENLMRAAPLSPELQREIQRFVTLSRGFDAWDRFDHARAEQILTPYQAEIVPQWKFLKTLVGKAKGTGYEPVFDLVSNAKRRAARGRYDDAVARLYRALELMAQIRLNQREPSLNSGDLKPELLPESLRPNYANRQGKIKLGLLEDYDLLAALDDPLGKAFAAERNKMLSTLEKRNASILAHGIQPCDENIYNQMYAETMRLLEQGLKAINVKIEIPQFPQTRQGKII